MENYLGQIMLFGFQYAPVGWAFCDGSLLSINDNQALYTLLGTTYGGDGVNSFALPDLRGRVPIHMGQGPNLSNYEIGEMGGSETITLLSQQMAQHTHAMHAATADTGNTNVPGPGVIFGVTDGKTNLYAATPGPTPSTLGPSIGLTGGNQAHDNIMPTLVGNYCIALEGIYPSRQ